MTNPIDNLIQCIKEAQAAYEALSPTEKAWHDHEQPRPFVRGVCPSNKYYDEWCKIVDQQIPPLPKPEVSVPKFTKINEVCKNCRWWTTYKGSPFGTGICRGAPPIVSAIIHSSKQMTAASWPATCPDDWCGKFELECTVLEQSEKLDGTIVQTIRLRDGKEIVRELKKED